METSETVPDTAAGRPSGTDTEPRTCSFAHVTALEFDPSLRELMAEAPLTRIRMPYGTGEAWLATRYEDIKVITTDRRFSRKAVIGRDFPRMTPEPIVQDEAINLMDPPEYNRLRRLVAQGFTNRLVDTLRPATQRTVDRLLDAMEERGRPGDLAADLGAHLPMTTICELLDIPEEDRPELRANAVALMTLGRGDRDSAVRAKADLRAYFADLTKSRRRDPGEDLISRLCVARIGEEMLADDELAVLAMILLITGHDTTTYQISNMSYTLLTHPELMARLRAEPDLVPQAIEELLRWIPFRKGVGIPRIATEDVELAGVTIRSGDTVHISYLAANRDEQVYERPDELDVDREGPLHMTFGWGTHHCIGSHLALMELQTVVSTLVRRYPGLTLAVPPGEIEWNTSSIWRFPLTLPVTW
ncbi:Cytochrome P450 [Streptomyces aidingensis]|uniref:Cytochrome P450 n=1 Tax=Streptomyces aidingensis TaxID=910347 RepID=A0A1I1QWR3_9ACTN|nr:Cytochrome P450 [Streptomyces aidingensis]